MVLIISIISFRYTCDLWKAIRYSDVDADTQKKHWDDGLHLTAEGYKLMGDVIAVRMFELIRSVEDPVNVVPAAIE